MATTPGPPAPTMGNAGPSIDLTPLATNGRMIAQQLGILATAVAGLQLTGTVPVSQGGTGQTSLTQNGVLYGNGTLAVGVTSQGAANSILVANAGAPSFSAAPTIGTSLTCPLLIGGSGTTGTQLTLQTTTGTGSTDAMAFKGGTNGGTTFATLSAVGLGVGSAPSAAWLTAGAGTTTKAAVTLTSGTNLTSAAAGAVEYDGVQNYFTIDTSSGRGARPVEQYFHLTSAGSTVSTIANYFGTTSNISLVASGYYIIEIVCFFLKTTAGTVTWTFTNSAAPTSQNIYFEMSPVTGIITGAPATGNLFTEIYNDNTAAKALTPTGTNLTTGVNHYMRTKIWLQNGTGTSLQIQATCSAGSLTPGINSYWTCRRMSPNNIGTFAA